MNLKEIMGLPNHISIPLLIHKIKNTNKQNKIANLGDFTIYLEMRTYVEYLIFSFKRPIKFKFELIYGEKLYPSIVESCYGGDIQYSQYKEIYDINDLDTNQFILTYGKDPFSLKKEMEDFTENVGSDIFEDVKQFLLEIINA